jgi:hypothetical protein
MRREIHISENQTRIFLSLDEMPEVTAFAALFEYWLARRSSNGRPPLSEGFDPASILSDADRPWLATVNVVAENPYNFMFEAHAPSDSFAATFGKPLGAIPDTEHADCLADEFLFIKQNKEPRLDRIDHIAAAWHRHYDRLGVPVICGKTGQVVRVFTTVNRLEPSRLISSLSSDAMA